MFIKVNNDFDSPYQMRPKWSEKAECNTFKCLNLFNLPSVVSRFS